MKVKIQPYPLSGIVHAPPSKSVFQRAVAGALLSDSPVRISNPCFVNDGISALAMAGALGAEIEESGDDLIITGGLSPRQSHIDAGESGLGIRLFTPIAALADQPIEVRAEGSLLNRPMGQFNSAFEALGVKFDSSDGMPPLSVQGPMRPGEINLDGSLSSQFVSGLLMTLPTLDGDSSLKVENPVSTPYIDMTLEVMNAFGVHVIHRNYESYHIEGNQRYEAEHIHIPGDWSGGAALLVAAALAGEGQVFVAGLDRDLPQADQAIIGAMLFAGCKMSNDPDGIRVTAHKIRGFEFDATHCPDLFPPLTALACFAEKPSKIIGVHRLVNKESNRAEALIRECAKAGIQIEIETDALIVHPGKVQPCEWDCHNDHRIAMTGALLALGGKVNFMLNGVECLDKSYPDFLDDLRHLGARIQPVKN